MFSSQICQRNLLKKSLLNTETSILTRLTTKCSFSLSSKHQTSAQAAIDEKSSKVFFSRPAQTLMKKITGLDLEKVNQFRTLPGPLKDPLYKFMTTEMLEKCQKDAIKKSLAKLQMPPLIPINETETEILEYTPEIVGLSKSKFVFTDITYNVTDRKRLVVVREPNGILRKANSFEKHRMNQLFFPKPGREYKHPRMFQKENLEHLWERREFLFILDRACVQFEPDDPEYHEVVFGTYERINDKQTYDLLRSTRHYGPFVFYLCLSKNLNNLLKENIETNKFDDAVRTIQLYTLIHPDCKFKTLDVNPEDKLKYIKSFVDTEMSDTQMINSILENLLIQAEKDKEQQSKEE
ncbi:small ribosomal subunit protein mS22 [Planococcus citri]|uniref:small ribosomal subunit protein mS22 n=1 Tax=Planococcus citri TaxID=170843 RepID=UPI0031F7CDA3